ncbi:hypothetical protein PRZ48_015240 [Zasmidium cellare]|uniref:Uncharacterized protein n=1 Tax=Zasmidium cellare TaxID=395010 RepID=A0ABR0DYR1_ZASCE|nr:hypothetical protein PRZ48_015240 [Zasmidium cellare]
METQGISSRNVEQTALHSDPTGPLRIAVNDPNQPKPSIKSASTIFPEEVPQIAKKWDDPGVVKGVNRTFLLKGRVDDDDDPRLLTGPLTNQDFIAMKTGQFTRYVKSTLQNSMTGTGPSSWLMYYISSQVQLENLKIKIEARPMTSTRRGTHAAIVDEECIRLQKIIDDHLTGWPRNEFQKLGVPELVTLLGQLPAERLKLGKREASIRNRFWRDKAGRKVINSYCRAHAGHIQLNDMTSATSPKWTRKIVIQFGFNCDLAHIYIVEPRLESEKLKHVDNRRLRVNVVNSTQEGGYFTQMKNFGQTYIANRWDGGRGEPTMAELLVKSQDTAATLAPRTRDGSALRDALHHFIDVVGADLPGAVVTELEDIREEYRQIRQPGPHSEKIVDWNQALTEVSPLAQSFDDYASSHSFGQEDEAVAGAQDRGFEVLEDASSSSLDDELFFAEPERLLDILYTYIADTALTIKPRLGRAQISCAAVHKRAANARFWYKCMTGHKAPEDEDRMRGISKVMALKGLLHLEEFNRNYLTVHDTVYLIEEDTMDYLLGREDQDTVGECLHMTGKEFGITFNARKNLTLRFRTPNRPDMLPLSVPHRLLAELLGRGYLVDHKSVRSLLRGGQYMIKIDKNALELDVWAARDATTKRPL